MVTKLKPCGHLITLTLFHTQLRINRTINLTMAAGDDCIVSKKPVSQAVGSPV